MQERLSAANGACGLLADTPTPPTCADELEA
jgi:hypothetical protein